MSGDNSIVILPLRRRPRPRALATVELLDQLGDSFPPWGDRPPADPADTSEVLLLLRNIDRNVERIAATLEGRK